MFANHPGATRSVNFLAAHDGLTLHDITAYKRKHNLANGENDRDGHGENFSWNHGHEGETPAPGIRAKRIDDIKAMLAILFISRGTPLITAGDEFGRTQRGNNNAYAQDNKVTWLDWAHRDIELENFTAELSAMRHRHWALQSDHLLTGRPLADGREADIVWFRADGLPMETANWEDSENRFLGLVLTKPPQGKLKADQIAIVINRSEGRLHVTLPKLTRAKTWKLALATRHTAGEHGGWAVPNHTVAVFEAGGKAKG